ncbi:interleukin-4 receptor subunit alpha [Leptodactylus fuscus]|uniref:interleukin-4 receptor subunit alpha n=1 Tax=Leptodactylus fuscus TaxID=238119 RepID=UPI003F4F3E90
MTASRIKAEILQTSLIWVTALIIASSHSQQIPRITNLDCLNDFDTTMVCSWEVVNGDINCSSDFQLKYRESYKKSSQYCKDLDNEYYKNFRVPNKCTCNITVIVFTLSDKYIINVESQGQNVGNATIDVASSAKPRTPTILNVNLSNSEIGVVNWRTNYDREDTKSMLHFYIQIISMEDDKTALENKLPQIEPRYTFSKKDLSRGQDYRVRVKAKFKEQTEIIWSEWSPEFEFRNDYNLTIEERLLYIIPISCAVLLPLIVLGYFCITRTKENWWNNIPDPARSKLAESNLSPRNYVKPAAKPDPEKSWGKCLVQLVKDSKKSKCEQFTKEHPLQDHLVGNYMTKIIFQPEVVDIEKYLHLYPRRDDTEYPEDSPEDKEEDIPLMPMDVSIGNMFCDILSDSPVMVDGLEHFNVDNAFGNFGSPILRDSGQKTLRHLPLSMVSQESRYQSYDSNNSSGDSKSDGSNPIYLDQCSLSQGDFSPCAPVSRIGESGSEMCNEDVFMSSGYNSFASALTCYGKELPQAATPTSDHGVETSTSSGYQSFNQAVQQGDTTCIAFDSGYKPFESLTSSCTSSEDDAGSK